MADRPSAADARNRPAVLQVTGRPGAARGGHPAPDRLPEQLQCGRQPGQPVLGDLLGLQHDGGEAVIIEAAAVEEEPDAAGVRWPAGAGGPAAAEIHAGQPPGPQVKPALLADLAPAGVPRRLPVGFHDAAGDGPARLIGRLEYQQPPRLVEDYRSG